MSTTQLENWNIGGMISQLLDHVAPDIEEKNAIDCDTCEYLAQMRKNCDELRSWLEHNQDLYEYYPPVEGEDY